MNSQTVIWIKAIIIALGTPLLLGWVLPYLLTYPGIDNYHDFETNGFTWMILSQTASGIVAMIWAYIHLWLIKGLGLSAVYAQILALIVLIITIIVTVSNKTMFLMGATFWSLFWGFASALLILGLFTVFKTPKKTLR